MRYVTNSVKISIMEVQQLILTKSPVALQYGVWFEYTLLDTKESILMLSLSLQIAKCLNSNTTDLGLYNMHDHKAYGHAYYTDLDQSCLVFDTNLFEIFFIVYIHMY